jgi:hypothetical protein
MLHNTAENINLASLTFWSNNWGVLYCGGFKSVFFNHWLGGLPQSLAGWIPSRFGPCTGQETGVGFTPAPEYDL